MARPDERSHGKLPGAPLADYEPGKANSGLVRRKMFEGRGSVGTRSPAASPVDRAQSSTLVDFVPSQLCEVPLQLLKLSLTWFVTTVSSYPFRQG